MPNNIFGFVEGLGASHHLASQLSVADFLLKISTSDRNAVLGVCGVVRALFNSARKTGRLTLKMLRDAAVSQIRLQMFNCPDLEDFIAAADAVFDGRTIMEFGPACAFGYFSGLVEQSKSKAPALSPGACEEMLLDRLFISRIGGELSFYNGSCHVSNSVACKSQIRKVLGLIDATQRDADEIVYRVSTMAMPVQQARVNDHGVDYVSVANGILRLDSSRREVALLPPNPHIVLLNSLPVSYDPAAKDEAVCDALGQWANGDPGVRDNIAEAMGMCLTRRSYKKSVLIVGKANGGKSAFIKRLLMERLLGQENCIALSLTQIMDRFSTILAKDKLLMVADDISPDGGDPNGQAVLKQLIDGLELKGERKGEQPVNFKPYSKILAASNFISRFEDEALAKRFYVIPFDGNFENQTVNEEIYSPRALSCWLNLMIEGFFRIEEHRAGNEPIFTPCRRCEEANAQLMAAGRTSSESYLSELSHECREDAIEALTWDFVNRPACWQANYQAQVYAEYVRWTRENGEKAASRIEFCRTVQRMFPELVLMDHRTRTGEGGRTHAYFYCKPQYADKAHTEIVKGIFRVQRK